ncbi:Serine/Threonine kinase [Naegleria gruberi]|uniref:non-specific serine/threonine protein kinase n=1 Tax=Naegleria gruberi TaxID=5762 RepID=D2VRV2_NAEGR|nr:Serine/Threonine kinase [Naegleria gruberi]EFC40529.1 Serine/Threonine kinase [Naegleria gruberi]|eukprot:XP_002673273.1 Serine/Threonine kinase [Naegleria gruberi strain NEG-M]
MSQSSNVLQIPLICEISSFSAKPKDFGWSKESSGKSKLADFIRSTVYQAKNVQSQHFQQKQTVPNSSQSETNGRFKYLSASQNSKPNRQQVENFSNKIIKVNPFTSDQTPNFDSNMASPNSILQKKLIRYPTMEIKKTIIVSNYFHEFILNFIQRNLQGFKFYLKKQKDTTGLDIYEYNDKSFPNSGQESYFFSYQILQVLNHLLENNQKELFQLWIHAHDFFSSETEMKRENSSGNLSLAGSFASVFDNLEESPKSTPPPSPTNTPPSGSSNFSNGNNKRETNNNHYLNSKYISPDYLRNFLTNDPYVQTFVHNVTFLSSDMFPSVLHSHRGKTFKKLIEDESNELETFLNYVERLHENITSVYEKNHLYMRLSKVLNKQNFVKDVNLKEFLQQNSTDFEFLRYPDLDAIKSVKVLKFIDMLSEKSLEIISHDIRGTDLEPLEFKIADTLLKSSSAKYLKQILDETHDYESKIVSDPKFDRLFEVVPSLFEPFMLPMKTLMAIIDQTMIIFNHGIDAKVTGTYVLKNSTSITNDLMELKMFIKKSEAGSGLYFHNVRYVDYLAYVFSKNHNRLFEILKKTVLNLSKQFDWNRASSWIDSIMERYHGTFFMDIKKRFGFKDNQFSTFLYTIITVMKESMLTKHRQEEVKYLLELIPKELPEHVKNLPLRSVEKLDNPFDNKVIVYKRGIIPPVPIFNPLLIRPVKSKEPTAKRIIAGKMEVYSANQPYLIQYRNKTMDNELIDRNELYYLFLTTSIFIEKTNTDSSFKLISTATSTIKKEENTTTKQVEIPLPPPNINQPIDVKLFIKPTPLEKAIPPPPPPTLFSKASTPKSKSPIPLSKPKSNKMSLRVELEQKLKLFREEDDEEDPGQQTDNIVLGIIEKAVPLYSTFIMHNLPLKHLLSMGNVYMALSESIKRRFPTFNKWLPDKVIGRICLFTTPTSLFILSLVSKQFFVQSHSITWQKEIYSISPSFVGFPALVHMKVKCLIHKHRQNILTLRDCLHNSQNMYQLADLKYRLKGIGFEAMSSIFDNTNALINQLTYLYQEEKQFALIKYFYSYYKLIGALHYEVSKLSTYKLERDILKKICASHIVLICLSKETLPNVSNIPDLGSHPIAVTRNMLKTVSLKYPNVNICMVLSYFYNINETYCSKMFEYCRLWKNINDTILRYKENLLEVEKIFQKEKTSTDGLNKFTGKVNDLLNKTNKVDKSKLVEYENQIIKYLVKCGNYYRYYLTVYDKSGGMSLDEAMFVAIQLNQFEELKELISKGANVNALRKGKDIAAESLRTKNQEMIDYCHLTRIDNIQKSNEKLPVDMNLLLYAIDNKYWPVVEIIARKNKELCFESFRGLRPIDYCIVNSKYPGVELFINAMITDDKNFNVEVLSKACFIAIDYGMTSALKYLVQKEPELATRRTISDIRYQESHYSNPSLILYALRKRSTKSVVTLIEMFPKLLNARLNHGNEAEQAPAKSNSNGKTGLSQLINNGTPLTFAVETNQQELAFILVEKGADVDVKKNGMDLASVAETTENSDMIIWARKLLNKSETYLCYKFEVEYIDNMLNLYRKRFKMVVNYSESVQDFVKKTKLRCGIRGSYELQYYDPDFEEFVDVVDMKDLQLLDDELNLIKLKRVKNTVDSILPQRAGNGRYEQYLGMTLDDRYKIIRIIGEGGFGIIFECQVLNTPEEPNVAIKTIATGKNSIQKPTQDAENEANLVKQLDHQNVVKIYDTFQVDTEHSSMFCIVMELYKGDVMSIISESIKSATTIPLPIIWKIISQTTQALNYVHSQQVMHRDIKPQNIFIRRRDIDSNLIEVVLGDFGIAKENAHTTKNTYAGSLCYISPELLLNQPYGFATDMYSLGVTLYQLLTLDTSTSICSKLIHSEEQWYVSFSIFLINGLINYSNYYLFSFQEMTKAITDHYSNTHNQALLNKLLNIMTRLLKFLPQARLTAQQLVQEVT